MSLNDYAEYKKICCFCERIYDGDEIICGICDSYKGLMTLAEYSRVYGDE